MPNPWILLTLLIVWLASLAGVGYWQNGAGHTAERVTWQARENTELAGANQKIQALEEAYRAQEQQHAEQLNTIAVNYQKELDDANSKTEDLVRRARAGAFRLRDPGARTHATCGNQLPEIAAGAGGRDDTGDRGLSTDAAGFLLGLAGRCNRVSRKLSACQAIIISDRARDAP
jgi:prophage endopeptidase